MIIVSQDKTRITENIEFQIEKQKMGEKYLILNNAVFFGVYETKERAMEILREISIAYANITMINIPKINIHELIPSQEMLRNIAYQMPEK